MSEFSEFITAQRHALDKAIYLESEKLHHDLRYDSEGKPTNAYFLQWIEEHSCDFRDAWNTSLCKKCKNVFTCYDCLKDQCNSFEEMPK
jgi:hypothetical protein